MARQWKLQFTSMQRAQKQALACSGTWSFHSGLRISKDSTSQCYSTKGVEQSEQALSDCSAVLYLGYLRVSKISLRKECSKPACKERQAGLHWTSCCCSLPRDVEMQHTVSWSTEQLTHWISQCFGVPARWSTQFEVCGITFYRILPPKYTIQPLLGSIQMYFKTLST